MKYEIKGGVFPVVVCELEDGEQMRTEKGAMAWMSPNMEMETRGGGFTKALSRTFSHESMFQNIYTARGRGRIAFGSSFPGRILVLDIAPGRELIVKKRGFLASEMGVELSVQVNKKASTGIFGGEGFVMGHLSGNGIAFVEINGEVEEYELGAGEQMIIQTGNVAAFESTVTMDVESVKGLKNKMLGGEGFFNTRLTGPGRIWLQTMPASTVAEAVRPYLPTSSS